MLYRNREEAGLRLAQELLEYKNERPIILALPRGGVPVAFEIAKKLDVLFDVLVVRKLSAPGNSELGIGAIGPDDVKVLDYTIIKSLGISTQEIDQVEKVEKQELQKRVKLYRAEYPIPNLTDKLVILVDDGLATGVTAKAAISYILKQHAKELVVAIPVGALDSVEGIRSIVRPMKDRVVCLYTPYDFVSVGLWYQDFSPVTDQEVVSLMQKARQLQLNSA